MDDDDYSMDISYSDDEEIDVKEPTYKVVSIDEITNKMEKTIEAVVSSTEVIQLIPFIIQLNHVRLEAKKKENFLTTHFYNSIFGLVISDASADSSNCT